jgi:hypothetical protein
MTRGGDRTVPDFARAKDCFQAPLNPTSRSLLKAKIGKDRLDIYASSLNAFAWV